MVGWAMMIDGWHQQINLVTEYRRAGPRRFQEEETQVKMNPSREVKEEYKTKEVEKGI